MRENVDKADQETKEALSHVLSDPDFRVLNQRKVGEDKPVTNDDLLRLLDERKELRIFNSPEIREYLKKSTGEK